MRRRLVHPLERERRLEQIRWRVRLAVGPLDWRERLRWWGFCASPVLVPLGIGAAVAGAVLLLWLLTLPAGWTLDQRLRHVASAPGCAWARSMGLAPTRRGEPGYFALHDGDADGIACEPFVPDRTISLNLLAARSWEAARGRLWPRPPVVASPWSAATDGLADDTAVDGAAAAPGRSE